MTTTQRIRIIEVLYKVESASIAFCYPPKRDDKDTDFPVSKAIAEIERILKEEG